MDLLEVNASRVAGDLAERVREGRRQIEATLRESMRGVGERAASALEWARATRARGVEEVGRAAERLDAMITEIELLSRPAGPRAA